jgi:hypothetical protein
MTINFIGDGLRDALDLQQTKVRVTADVLVPAEAAS